MLSGSIASREDHGYVVDLGVKGINAFLKNKDADQFIADYNEGVIQYNLLYKAAASPCLSVSSLYPPFSQTRPLDHDQIRHVCSDRYGNLFNLNKLAP